MKYAEKYSVGDKYRKQYISSIENMIENRKKLADIEREKWTKNILKSPEEYRNELKKMLGWPLDELTSEIPRVKTELVTKEDDIEIYRVVLYLPIGVRMYGILFKHSVDERLPFVISQHGGQGTPELCSSMLETGSGNYNDMSMRIFDKGVNVFAPQLLLWNTEHYDAPYDRLEVEKKLKHFGSSITAVEVYGIIKIIDYFETMPYVDKDRIGMAGLSYGGFYTMFTAACDPRIKAAYSCSQYNNRYKNLFTDWSWFNAGYKFSDNEVAMLIYPRKFFIGVGDCDETFLAKYAKEEFEKLKEKTKEKNWVKFKIFEGEHEFDKDEDVIIDFINCL